MTCLKLENGQNLMKYCRLNKIPYTPVWERIDKKGMTPDQAIKDYIDSKGKPKICKWYYKGETLRQYCKKRGLPYQRIVNHYWRQNKYNKIDFKHCTMEEVIKLYEKYTDFI